MKVNPTSGATGVEERNALLASGKGMVMSSSNPGQSNLNSLSKSRQTRRDKKHNCNKLLRRIVDGKWATIIMSLITLFALFGVSSNSNNIKPVRMT